MASTCSYRRRVRPSACTACSCTTATAARACASARRRRCRREDGPPNPAVRKAPNKLGAVASPDGRFIYYAERKGLFSYDVQFPLWQIVRFDRRTGETATITNAQGSAMRPVLSPDGKWLVYATRFDAHTGLRIRNLETRRRALADLSRHARRPGIGRVARHHAGLRVHARRPSRSIVPIDGHIARVDVATGAKTSIPFTAKVDVDTAGQLRFENRIEDGPTVRARLVRWPAISPDGKQVAFSALNHLWIMDLPSGAPRRLTSLADGEFMPTWSPDGQLHRLRDLVEGRRRSVPGRADAGQPAREALATPRRTTASRRIRRTDRRSSSRPRRAAISSTRTSTFSSAGARADVLPDGAPSEIAGIEPTADADLMWIPAAGGDATLDRVHRGGPDAAFRRRQHAHLPDVGQGPVRRSGSTGSTAGSS